MATPLLKSVHGAWVRASPRLCLVNTVVPSLLSYIEESSALQLTLSHFRFKTLKNCIGVVRKPLTVIRIRKATSGCKQSVVWNMDMNYYISFETSYHVAQEYALKFAALPIGKRLERKTLNGLRYTA